MGNIFNLTEEGIKLFKKYNILPTDNNTVDLKCTFFNLTLPHPKIFINNLNSNIPPKPGIYFWFEKDKVVYVGRAINLRDRAGFKDHINKEIRQAKYTNKIFNITHISWIVIENRYELGILESAYIAIFSPCYNVKK